MFVIHTKPGSETIALGSDLVALSLQESCRRRNRSALGRKNRIGDTNNNIGL